MLWTHDLEALETVSQITEARDVLLRLAHLSGENGVKRFLIELDETEGLDDETKAAFADLAQDRAFLQALDDYVHRTRHVH